MFLSSEPTLSGQCGAFAASAPLGKYPDGASAEWGRAIGPSLASLPLGAVIGTVADAKRAADYRRYRTNNVDGDAKP